MMWSPFKKCSALVAHASKRWSKQPSWKDLSFFKSVQSLHCWCPDLSSMAACWPYPAIQSSPLNFTAIRLQRCKVMCFVIRGACTLRLISARMISVSICIFFRRTYRQAISSRAVSSFTQSRTSVGLTKLKRSEPSWMNVLAWLRTMTKDMTWRYWREI